MTSVRAPALIDPDVVELSAEECRPIDELGERLASETHYRVLGVEPGATLKQIRNAYFQLVLAFHPDKYFGRRLGVYATRLDALRTRLATINELLSNETRRRDYDAYLATQAATRELEARIASGAADAAPESRPKEPYRAAAEQALADGQWVSAVNAARVALTLSPDDETLRALLETASTKAAGELSTRFAAKAGYEEEKQDWEGAARSYERLAETTPADPAPLAKAAECLLRAGSDARGAVRCARGAVARAPGDASLHLLLARANEAAGLVESALGELRRALELTPKDASIAPWIARLRKGRA